MQNSFFPSLLHFGPLAQLLRPLAFSSTPDASPAARLARPCKPRQPSSPTPCALRGPAPLPAQPSRTTWQQPSPRLLPQPLTPWPRLSVPSLSSRAARNRPRLAQLQPPPTSCVVGAPPLLGLDLKEPSPPPARSPALPTPFSPSPTPRRSQPPHGRASPTAVRPSVRNAIPESRSSPIEVMVSFAVFPSFPLCFQFCFSWPFGPYSRASASFGRRPWRLLPRLTPPAIFLAQP